MPVDTASRMHPRERWLAALDFQPLDHLPFWAKIGDLHRRRWRPELPVDDPDLHAAFGSTPQGHAPACVAIHAPGWRVETREVDGRRRTVYRAPGGHELVQEYRFDPGSDSWHPVRFPVTDRRQAELLTDYYRACRVETVAPERLDAIRARVDQVRTSAPVATNAGESALMLWIEHLAGVEQAHYLLVDEPAAVGGLFEAIHRVLGQVVERLCASGLYDMVYLVENTSTTLISPAQYARHCFPQIADYAATARRHDARLILHMCGHLSGLLPQLARLPVCAFEAFTAPPVGDTRLADGRRACGDTALIGGTSAALWLRPADEIIAAIERDLDALPHHRGLVLSSAGVLPPACPPETARAVSAAIARFPLRR